MVGTFYDGYDELYHHAKSGEIEQRAPAVGAKVSCLFFCLSRSESGGPFARVGYTLNSCFVAVYGSTLMLFSSFFQK